MNHRPNAEGAGVFFINIFLFDEVLLKHNQVHLFMFCLWLLLCYSGSAERLPEKTL